MSSRDPRVDPKPGDRISNINMGVSFDVSYTVTGLERDRVLFDYKDGKVGDQSCTLDEWRTWTADKPYTKVDSRELLRIYYCGTKEEQPEGQVERAFVIAKSEAAAFARLAQAFSIPADQWCHDPEMGSSEGFTETHYTRVESDWQAEWKVREQLAEHGTAICFEETAPARPPAMSANELYAWKPEAVETDLWRLGSHVPELPEWNYDWDLPSKENRVQVRVLWNSSSDGERCTFLATVWFDEAPVMVIQNGGRGGRDTVRRYITNEGHYRAMVAYLLLFARDELKGVDVIDPTVPMRELTDFYCEDVLTLRGSEGS